MTLVELCEPLFIYLCRVNRATRAGISFPAARIRVDIQNLLQQLAEMARQSPDLYTQYQDAERVLIYFIDGFLVEAEDGYSAEWNQQRLAAQRGEQAGDERFFDELNTALADRSPQAEALLEVFYYCLGLGFVGVPNTQPDFEGDVTAYLQKKMGQMANVLRHRMPGSLETRICEDAYRNPDIRDLIEPPARKLGAIVIALVGLSLLTLIANIAMFNDATEDMDRALDTIERLTGPAAEPEGGP